MIIIIIIIILWRILMQTISHLLLRRATSFRLSVSLEITQYCPFRGWIFRSDRSTKQRKFALFATNMGTVSRKEAKRKKGKKADDRLTATFWRLQYMTRYGQE